MDGPSLPTNATPEAAAPAAAAAASHHAGPVGTGALLHWLRDATLALPVGLVALLIAGAALAATARRLPALERIGSSTPGRAVVRGVAASTALAAGSPGHGLLFLRAPAACSPTSPTSGW